MKKFLVIFILLISLSFVQGVLASDGPINATITTSSNVTTLNTLVYGYNADIVKAIIINDSDTIIYLSEGQTAALNKGIRLNAAGGTYNMDPSRNPYKGPWYAICSTDNKNLTVAVGKRIN